MANQDVLKQHIGTIKKTNPVLKVIGKIFIYVVLIIGAIISLFPFFWMVSQSLMTLGETLQVRWLPAVPQWHNYAEAWNRARFGDYFLNSTWVTLGTIIGILITSILAAYAFARIEFPGRNLFFTLFLATMMVPESVTLIPNLFMVRGKIIPWGNWNDTFWVLTVPFMANAFSIFLLRQFFQQVPNELWDAARIDGAGHMRFLTQIVLPISTAPIVTVILFAFTGAWNAFSWPLIVTGRKWRTLMVGLYNFVSEAGTETQLLMAGAVISLIPILILYIFTQKQFTQGIATTGLKG
ncbi:MAG TPA: carbohydrate ABC transporter permease [Anaerolineaceae bacterium]|jgi:ABC-type glycerol-3-phosphate transport system permease component|nr:carbohydrate ABC transporter permease [Anaerolineaceae bacterium]HNZ14642.1 carbohydrate ABC transporter permease [Anaerolineaceae bacterium]